MKQFEYDAMTVLREHEITLPATLQTRGLDGWQLVSTEQRMNGSGLALFFMREIPQPTTYEYEEREAPPMLLQENIQKAIEDGWDIVLTLPSMTFSNGTTLHLRREQL